MKKVCLVLTTVLLLQSALWRKANASECSSKNPILQEFDKSKDIKINSAPVKYSQYCQGEWSTYGSCCEAESAKRFLEKEKGTIQRSFQELDHYIKNQFFNHYRNIIEYTQEIHQKKIKVHSSFVKLVELFTGNDSYTLNKLQELSSQASSSGGCGDELIKVRRSAICKICSGRSEKTFLAGKPLLSANYCKEINTKCRTQVLASLKFLSITNKVLSYLSQIDLDSVKSAEVRSDIKKLSSLQVMKSSDSINGLLKSLDSNSGDASSVQFCERLVKLTGPLYFEVFNKDLEVISKVLEFVRKDLEQIKQGKPSAWSVKGRTPSRRVLQIPNLAENLFIPNVIVVPQNLILKIDSSYTSYQGALGTKGNEAHKFYDLLPIDTSAMFP